MEGKRGLNMRKRSREKNGVRCPSINPKEDKLDFVILVWRGLISLHFIYSPLSSSLYVFFPSHFHLSTFPNHTAHFVKYATYTKPLGLGVAQVA